MKLQALVIVMTIFPIKKNKSLDKYTVGNFVQWVRPRMQDICRIAIFYVMQHA